VRAVGLVDDCLWVVGGELVERDGVDELLLLVVDTCEVGVGDRVD
jgi:hypothetical protein